MSLPIYFTFGICSSWLIFFSIMLYYLAVFDNSFDFFVNTGKKRLKCWLYMLFCLLLSYYLFVVRLSRVGNSINIYEIGEKGKELLFSLALIDTFIILILLLLIIIFWILLLKCIYQHLKKCLLALYIYYYQYDKFRSICIRIFLIRSNYHLYLWKRVKIFTENIYILGVATLILPYGINFIERNLFYFFIPYLIYYDIMIQNGVLSKIFIIMPWFYLYSLIRSFFIIFFKLHKLENWQLSAEVYGYARGFKF